MSSLYFLYDPKARAYWDGSYHYRVAQRWGTSSKRTEANKALAPGFRKSPRLFRSPAALLTSLRRLPRSWTEAFAASNPEPVLPADGRWTAEMHNWRGRRSAAWRTYVKTNKLTSIAILRLFGAQGWHVKILNEGAALKSAKAL